MKMKKVFKIIIILVVAVILGIDFYGLWKYKLSGKQYVLESGSDEGSEDTYVEDSLEDLTEDKKEAIITIASIKYIDIDGNTYIYLIDDKNEIFKAKASDNENMLLLNVGDKVKIICSGKIIVSCEKI